MKDLPEALREAGWTIEPSGSGCNLELFRNGEKITYAPRYGFGWQMLVNVAWAMEEERLVAIGMEVVKEILDRDMPEEGTV